GIRDATVTGVQTCALPIWSTPAVDPATNTAYVGSGNPFQKDKEHPHTDAILKFDVNRSSASFGQIVGVYKGNVDTYTDVHTLPRSEEQRLNSSHGSISYGV